MPIGYPPRPPVRRMDGVTRLLIVVGAVAIAVYTFGPYFKSEMGEIGRQLRTWNMHLDENAQDTIEDRRGERIGRGRRGRGGDLADQLGPPPQWDRGGPPEWGERSPGPETTGGPPPYRDARTAPDEHHARRWRDCQVGRNGGLSCGPWQPGAPPQRGGGQW
jgi:hypothetical protein